LEKSQPSSGNSSGQESKKIMLLLLFLLDLGRIFVNPRRMEVWASETSTLLTKVLFLMQHGGSPPRRMNI
jgi:hypothetical protein